MREPWETSDGNGGFAFTQVEVTVNPVNDAPVAPDDNFPGDEDSLINGVLFADDVDFSTDFDEHTFSLGTNVANGTVVVDEFGSFEYTPDANFNGIDAFTYIVTDLAGESDTGIIGLTVDPVNDDPTVVPFIEISGDEDTVLSGALNASDIDGDVLSFSVLFGSSFGSVIVNPDGSFEYTPDQDANSNSSGIDLFEVETSDGNGGFAFTQVGVTVNPVNDAPTAQDDSFEGDEDSLINGVLFADDVDFSTDFDEQHTFSLDTDTANGAVVVDEFGSFEYTPDENFNGTDEFTYTVTDLAGASDTGTISLTVNPVNDNPMAVPFIEISGDEDTVLSGALNASDIDGDVLSFSVFSEPSFGSVNVNPDSSFEYSPDQDVNINFSGTDFFEVETSDGNGGFAFAQVGVTVNPVNDAPTAQDDSFEGDEDSLINGVLFADDVDFSTDFDEHTFSINTGAANGAVIVNAFGDFEYTPDADFNGTDEFTYTVTDLAGESDTGPGFRSEVQHRDGFWYPSVAKQKTVLRCQITHILRALKETGLPNCALKVLVPQRLAGT